MKAVIGSIVTATAASACCLGPVVFSLVGAGALAAVAVRLEPLRPIFLTITGAFLVAGFWLNYRGGSRAACASEGRCPPASTRATRALLWIATALVLLIVTFPYYMTWFI
jgi:mercuric ion transport protein